MDTSNITTDHADINNGNPAPQSGNATSLSAVSSPEHITSSMQYNIKSPAVKRIMREAAEMARNTDDGVFAKPLEDNIFEWHFTIRGTENTEFELGLYHGRIILPAEYPMKPPSIIMLTPNGRFETGMKICLSISSYHPETWRPSWSIRTALLALQSFMNTPSPGAIGSLDYPADARRNLARKSIGWECPTCGPNFHHPVFKTMSGTTNLAINGNVNGIISVSSALRVFHGPTSSHRDMVTEPVPNHANLPFHDNRAGDVPRFGIDDAPGNNNPTGPLEPVGNNENNNLFGVEIVIDFMNGVPLYTTAIGAVVGTIIGLVLRRFYNSFFT